MPLNIPGILVPFQLFIFPRFVVPSIIIKDIRQLDFPELRKAGYRGAVFDKDNCLALPHRDQLVPELTEAWKECRETFGEGNVLIVSNSAGSHLDAGEIQAESVSYHLSVPVLRHPSFKPSYSCISSIRAYFSSLPAPIADDELIIVGDRIFTDVVMANRMAHQSGKLSQTEGVRRDGPLAVWTSGVWQRESMPMRWLEKSFMHGVQRWALREEDARRFDGLRRFVKEVPEAQNKDGLLKNTWRRIRRT